MASEPLLLWCGPPVAYAFGDAMHSDQSLFECGELDDQCPGLSGDGVGKFSGACIKCWGVKSGPEWCEGGVKYW